MTPAERIEAQRLELEQLRKANNLLDSALRVAFPRGATGVVFDYWNDARIALSEITHEKALP